MISITNKIKLLEIKKFFFSKFPVYAGAEQGFLEEFKTDNFFGLDGFGNVNFTDDQTTVKIDRSKHAAVALVDMVKKYPGKKILIS